MKLYQISGIGYVWQTNTYSPINGLDTAHSEDEMRGKAYRNLEALDPKVQVKCLHIEDVTAKVARLLNECGAAALEAECTQTPSVSKPAKASS